MKNLSKKVMISVCTVVLILGLTGCGVQTAVGKDIKSFYKEISSASVKLTIASNELIAHLSNVDGMRSSDIAAGINKQIPVFKECAAEMKQAQPKTDEVKQLQASYVIAIEKYVTALERTAQAVDANSGTMMQQAVVLIAEAQNDLTQVALEAQELASKNGVKLTIDTVQ